MQNLLGKRMISIAQLGEIRMVVVNLNQISLKQGDVAADFRRLVREYLNVSSFNSVANCFYSISPKPQQNRKAICRMRWSKAKQNVSRPHPPS